MGRGRVMRGKGRGMGGEALKNMNTNYRFCLHVEMPKGERKVSAFEVDAYVGRDAKWDPYDLCSDEITAALANGVTSLGAERIDAEREKLAKEISKHVTAHIMNAIKSRDLCNGYVQE
jgi:hypothetical protein